MSELSAGYSSAKLITGLQTAKALLKNHGVGNLLLNIANNVLASILFVYEASS
jgi:hypothetical protein